MQGLTCRDVAKILPVGQFYCRVRCFGGHRNLIYRRIVSFTLFLSATSEISQLHFLFFDNTPYRVSRWITVKFKIEFLLLHLTGPCTSEPDNSFLREVIHQPASPLSSVVRNQDSVVKLLYLC